MGGASGRKCRGCVSLTGVVVLPGGHHQQQVGPQCRQQEDNPASRLPVPPGVAVPAQPQAVRLREHPARSLATAPCWQLLFLCVAHPSALSDLQLRQEAQKRLSGEMGEGIGDYDYNNANDTANFCPALEVAPPGCVLVAFRKLIRSNIGTGFR